MEVLIFYHVGKKIAEGAVYIGRYNHNFNLPASKFANPFPVSKEAGGRGSTIEKYKKWLWQQLITEKITKSELLELDGKNLVCYCKPQACHGDVILSAIKWVKSSDHALEDAISNYKEQQKANSDITYKVRRKLS